MGLLMIFLYFGSIILNVQVISTATTLNNVTHLTTPTGNVSLVATPTMVLLGLTKTLELTCSYLQHQRSKGSSVTSLVLYKADDVNGNVYSELATVNYLSGANVHVKDLLGASEVTGEVNNQGRSYIQYKWTYSSIATIGDYRCDAYVMTGSRIQARSITGTVAGEVPKMDDLLDQTKELEIQTANQTAILSDVSNEVKDTKADLVKLSKRLDTQAAQLEYINNQTTSLNELIDRFHPNWTTTLSPSATFKGHQYFLSAQKTVADVFQGLVLCQSLGGYLAEVDDFEERKFIQDFVKENSHDDYIYLGSHDMDGDGNWNHFRNGRPMTYKGALDGDSNEKCAVLQGGGFGDYTCTASSPKQCLCEKS